MKKLVLMMAIALGTTVVAQEKKTDRKMMSSEVRVERMTKELDLTVDQQSKVKDIFDRKKEVFKAHKVDRKADKAVKKEAFAKMKTEMAQFDKEIKSVLTPDQIKKYDAKREKMMNKRHKRMAKKSNMKETK